MRIDGNTPVSSLYHSDILEERPDVICHYGVKGMKWGVRRFQNTDGTLTNVGKKRYAKAIRKAAKSNTVEQRRHVTASVRDDLERNFGSRLRAHALNLRTKRDALELAQLDEDEYWDSDAHRKDSKVAYKNTVDWFKKNQPDYLNKIIRDNGGKTTDLDAYHDFRKMLDGAQDEAWSTGRDRWNKQHGHDMKALQKDYEDARKKAVDEVLGKYGYQKIDKVNSWDSNKNTRDIVEDAIVMMNYEKHGD